MDTTVESFLFLMTIALLSGMGGAATWVCAGPWVAVMGWVFSAGAVALRGPGGLSFLGELPYDAKAAVAAERAELDQATAKAKRASKTHRL